MIHPLDGSLKWPATKWGDEIGWIIPLGTSRPRIIGGPQDNTRPFSISGNCIRQTLHGNLWVLRVHSAPATSALGLDLALCMSAPPSLENHHECHRSNKRQGAAQDKPRFYQLGGRRNIHPLGLHGDILDIHKLLVQKAAYPFLTTPTNCAPVRLHFPYVPTTYTAPPAP